MTEKDVYLWAFNVPQTFLVIKKFDLVIELRATLVNWDNEEPKFIVELNNLNILTAAAIKWIEFEKFVQDCCTSHFKITYGKQ